MSRASTGSGCSPVPWPATRAAWNGFDIDLAAGATRLASRLRDALTSISPVLERAVGERLHQAGVRDLLAACPTLTALRAVSQSRIERTVKARSPRIAAKVSTAVAAALAARDVTVTWHPPDPSGRIGGDITQPPSPLDKEHGDTSRKGMNHSQPRGTDSRNRPPACVPGNLSAPVT